MRYLEHPPSPRLRERIACFWSLTAPAGSPGHRVLPDGSLDLLFDLGAAPVVVGAMTRAIVTEPTTRATQLLGVRFRPGEAAAVLGVSARELADQAIELEAVWGARGHRVADAVLEQRSLEMRLAFVERAIEERLLLRPRTEAQAITTARVRAAVARMRRAEVPSIDDVARELGVTARTLERAFDERVGLRPKTFARVLRVQRVAAAIDRGVTSMSALAHDVGYADQSHLVRDVRELTGLTARELLRERRAMSDSFQTASDPDATVPPSIARRT